MIATATYRGHTYTASRMWHGQVRALSPPTRTGPLAVRRALHLVAGRWSGGWGGETDQLGAEACRTRSGQGCRMLAGGEQGCPDASSHRRLGGWFTGAYVFVVDARLASEEICAGTGHYGGAYQTADGTIHVGLTRQAPADVAHQLLAQVPGASIVTFPARYTWSDLSDVADRLTQEVIVNDASPIVRIAADPETNCVQVGVPDVDDPAALAVKQEYGDAVELVQENPYVDLREHVPQIARRVPVRAGRRTRGSQASPSW